ncbi:FAD-binding protein [Candidatus Parcubacteria bacterium]|nr:MAG: FAD-binding protein [Candidatus Parcubacteria bacterium]
MLADIRGEVRFKESLAPHTSLRIGGPAWFYIRAQGMDDVRLALGYAAQERLPLFVLGGGNNILVADKGVEGVVLCLDGELNRVEFHGTEAVVGAGMELCAFIREAAARDLGGLDSLVGIPATIGGALAMNAGSAGGAMADFVIAVCVMLPDGTLREVRPGACPRDTGMIPAGSILVGCRLQLVRQPMHEACRAIRERIRATKHLQPNGLATTGRVWHDPPLVTARTLIERTALKGKRIGGAEISAKNANYIVNRCGASAADVLALMQVTRERVYVQCGVVLEPAIRLVGANGNGHGA